jgi:hypothetical protein
VDDTDRDKEIEELKHESKRFFALEAQLNLIGRVLMGMLATGLGVIGTLLVKWNDLEVSMTDLEGELASCQKESDTLREHVAEIHEDLKTVMLRQRAVLTKLSGKVDGDLPDDTNDKE